MTIWMFGSGDQEEAAAQARQDPRWGRLMAMGGAALELKPLGAREVSAMADGSWWAEFARHGTWRGFFRQDGSVPLAAQSDFLRLLVLERLGGVYVDADVLFLTSWRPLLCSFGGDFAYEWGPEGYMNTAVLAISKESFLGTCLLQAAARTQQARIANPFHPGELSRLAHEHCSDGLAMLPCEMFDPYWHFHYGRDGAQAPPWMGPRAEPSEVFQQLCLAPNGREATAADVQAVQASGALAFHLHAGACPAVEAGSWVRAALLSFYGTEAELSQSTDET